MENQEKNTLDDLLFANGLDSSGQGEISKTKKTKKKPKKVEPVVNKFDKKSYSLQDLENKSSDQLVKICVELNIPFVARRRAAMIQKILENK